jgi:hypothetical protein
MKLIVTILILNILSSCYIGKNYNNIEYPNQRYLNYDINLQQEDIKSMNGLYKYRNNYQLDEIKTEDNQEFLPPSQQEMIQDPFQQNEFDNYSDKLAPTENQIVIEEDYPEYYAEQNINEPIDNYYINNNYLNQSILPYDSNNTDYRIPVQFKRSYPYDKEKAAQFKKYSNLDNYIEEKRFLKKDITPSTAKFPEITSEIKKTKINDEEKKLKKYNFIDENYFSMKNYRNPKKEIKYDKKPTIIENKNNNKKKDIMENLIKNNPDSNNFFN